MKKLYKILTAVLLTALLAVGTGAAIVPARARGTTAVTVADKNLEALIKDKLDVDELTAENMLLLTSLDTPVNDPAKKIKSLSGLEHATNLAALDIDYNYVSDLTPLAGLTKLCDLDISYNGGISDLAPLADLSNLERFESIANDRVSDYSVVGSFKKLKKLNLSLCGLSDISFVEGLTGLQRLYLSFNQKITDVTPLHGLTDLVTLSLDNNAIADISALKNAESLVNLTLENNYVADFSPLYHLLELDTLNISRNFTADEDEANEKFGTLSSFTIYPLKNGMLDDAAVTLPATMNAGESGKITVTANDEITSLLFRSSAPDIIKVDKDGSYTALKDGTAVITVTANNIIKTVTVTVGRTENGGKGCGCGASTAGPVVGAGLCFAVAGIAFLTRRPRPKKSKEAKHEK